MENQAQKTPSAPPQPPTAEEQNALIDTIIGNLSSNNFNLFIYTPAAAFQSGGVMVLFRLARRLKDAGYNVKIIYEPQIDQKFSSEQSVKEKKQVEYFAPFNPTWLEFKIDDIEMIPLGDKEIAFTNKERVQAKPLTVNPEDFLFIPEGFGNIMQKTAGVACKRVVIAQSYFYILTCIQPGQNWGHFGINDAISISDGITQFLTATMPMVRVKNLKQSINRNLFKPPGKMSAKFPMVALSPPRGMESNMKVQNIIRLFYALYPHLQFVRFMQLGGMSREEFAESLASCCLFLHTDEIPGFGTLPLEAMACNTHVVGYSSFCMNEYVTQTNGFWTLNGDIFQAVEMLAIALDKWLNGEFDTPDIAANYETTLSKYSDEVENSGILGIMDAYKGERIAELSTLKIPVAAPAPIMEPEPVQSEVAAETTEQQ